MKKLCAMILCLVLSLGLIPIDVLAAPDWPSACAIQAEGGIVIDADTGTVLYGKNSHTPYFPASITKILTALIVIENSDLDDIVTFSHNAVYNVEAGSSNAGLDEGDTLTVRDCLYALLLQSANESANALAEHVAGSMEAFADMMNARARELGCEDSNFANPSGLNNPEHHTSAYDMAMIARAAFANDTFVEIDSTTFYKLPPTKRNPEGLRMTAHHQMMLKNKSVYYPGILGGKTGYTSLAGNTLVTCAKQDNMKLIAVVLNGHQTHYSDTKALLDFGFSNFQSLRIADYDNSYTSIEDDMKLSGITMDMPQALTMDRESTIILPKTAEFTDASSVLTYDLSTQDPSDAAAKVEYTYNDRSVGRSYLKINSAVISPSPAVPAVPSGEETTPDERETSTAASTSETVPAQTEVLQTEPSPEKSTPSKTSSTIFIVLAVILAAGALGGGGVALKIHLDKKEEQERLLRQARRQQRLSEAGISTDDFNSLLEQRRSYYMAPKKRSKRGRGKR